MAKEGKFGIKVSTNNEGPIWRETFVDPSSYPTYGVETDITLFNGIAIFNGTSSNITYQHIRNGVYSIRIKFDQLNPSATQYILDYRANGGVGYVRIDSATTVSASSGTIYVDGVAGSTISSSTKEITITGITLTSTVLYIGSDNTGANFLNGSLELIDEFDSTLTSNNVLSINNDTYYRTDNIISYWMTRKPKNLFAFPKSATEVDVWWDDAVEAAQGLKLYVSTDGVTYTYKSTIAFGVGSATISELTENTQYYIKLVAYKGSNESACDNTPIITTFNLHDSDNNAYTLIKVGVHYWMVENLKTTKYNNGSAIPLETVNATWAALTSAAYCWLSNDEATYKSRMGALYNGYAMASGILQPVGQRIPSNSDFNRLIAAIGGFTGAGGKLKEAGTTNWSSPNTGATNESGWTGRGGGYRKGTDGTFTSIFVSGLWWSNTPDTTKYYEMACGKDSADVAAFASFDKDLGFSVRCLIDQSWYGNFGLFYGDSIVAGSGASDAAHRWTSLFSAATFITETNQGYSKQALQNTGDPGSVGNFRDNCTASVPTRVASQRKSIAIAYGTNDIGYNFPGWTVAVFKAQYREVIQILNSKGWTKYNIVLIGPSYTNQTGRNAYSAFGVTTPADEQRLIDHNLAVKEVAAEYMCQYVDMYTYMKNNGGDALLDADGLHPNDTGYAAMSTYIQSVLK